MLTVYSEKHVLRDAKTELFGGQLVPPFECPVRAEYILERLQSVSLGEVIAPDEFGLDPVARIHDRRREPRAKSLAMGLAAVPALRCVAGSSHRVRRR